MIVVTYVGLYSHSGSHSVNIDGLFVCVKKLRLLSDTGYALGKGRARAGDSFIYHIIILYKCSRFVFLSDVL